ncbi:MAG: ABC-type transport system involved in cytochrome c biogenesis permease component [Phenylobacterium sp.]|jgi:ABC-type transport system involved in cytochrome c biogenesis permease component
MLSKVILVISFLIGLSHQQITNWKKILNGFYKFILLLTVIMITGLNTLYASQLPSGSIELILNNLYERQAIYLFVIGIVLMSYQVALLVVANSLYKSLVD